MAATQTVPPAQAAAVEFTARVVLDGRVLDDRAIRDEELARSRHALAYLKGRLGNVATRELLADDLARTTAQVCNWVERSAGRWRTARVELIVPGPDQLFVHTSIQAADEHGVQAAWLDPVSDEDYNRGTD